MVCCLRETRHPDLLRWQEHAIVSVVDADSPAKHQQPRPRRFAIGQGHDVVGTYGRGPRLLSCCFDAVRQPPSMVVVSALSISEERRRGSGLRIAVLVENSRLLLTDQLRIHQLTRVDVRVVAGRGNCRGRHVSHLRRGQGWHRRRGRRIRRCAHFFSLSSGRSLPRSAMAQPGRYESKQVAFASQVPPTIRIDRRKSRRIGRD